MRMHARHLYRFVFTGSTMFALSCAPSGAWAQRNNNNNQDQNQVQTQEFKRADLAAFDDFLDAHPRIATQLIANPALVSNQDFVGDHPALQTFLNGHARIQQQISANPDAFMDGLARFEMSRRDQMGGRTNGVNRSGNPDLKQGELASMDQFLDAHRSIEEQLEANPSLINNQKFLSDHPALQNFLKNYPKVQEEFSENPSGFMDQERRYEARPVERAGDVGPGGYPNVTRRDQASMDRFFDSHPSIRQQLAANPSLINNQQFLQNNPQFADFLKDHPLVTAAFQANPSHFMYEETRYEGSLADQTANNGDHNRRGNPNPDLTRAQVASMDQFLDSHQSIEADLQANPSLISNQKFLSDHPALQNFLNGHPGVQEEFAQNPQHFTLRVNRYEGTAAADQARDNGVNRNPNPGLSNRDLTRSEVASTDQFLDAHQGIERDLRSNPSLINNVSYLNKNPALRAFLSDHPQVREEFTENPSLFMRREGQYEATEYRNGGTRYYDRDVTQQDVSSMDQYLDKHAGEARELQAYPARVNDSDYLSHHKDLEAFFRKHPQVREEFTENPSMFMRAESKFEANAEMGEFLDAHKKIRKDLDENPGRVKDRDYLNHHKHLRSFLAKNPGVNDQVESDPDAFMRRERRFDADRDFDVYLTKHRGVAKDLEKDPARVKDDKYLDHHKDLRELLEKHPDLDQQAKVNPSALMQERMKFHEQYKNEHQLHQKTKVEERANEHPH